MPEQSLTILVVEDEPLVRMDIAEQLQDMGFKVLEAANADEAIEMLGGDTEIRIVFTDVDMPGSMDGLKLAAAVRDRWPPIRIIVTSGHRNVTMNDLPADSRFFAKPYKAAAIAQAAREMAG
jgi:two-component system, response regulator PdtaR